MHKTIESFTKALYGRMDRMVNEMGTAKGIHKGFMVNSPGLDFPFGTAGHKVSVLRQASLVSAWSGMLTAFENGLFQYSELTRQRYLKIDKVYVSIIASCDVDSPKYLGQEPEDYVLEAQFCIRCECPF